jgi:hypothetical protein
MAHNGVLVAIAVYIWELDPLLQSYLLLSPSLNLSHMINPKVDKTQNINRPKFLKLKQPAFLQ